MMGDRYSARNTSGDNFYIFERGKPTAVAGPFTREEAAKEEARMNAGKSLRYIGKSETGGSVFAVGKSDVLTYKGCKIEKMETTNVGYAPDRHNRDSHTFTPRRRQANGYLVTLLDGSEKFTDTLKAAKEYIDKFYD